MWSNEQDLLSIDCVFLINFTLNKPPYLVQIRAYVFIFLLNNYFSSVGLSDDFNSYLFNIIYNY